VTALRLHRDDFAPFKWLLDQAQAEEDATHDLGDLSKADVAERKTGAKKRRVRELRLNGDETGDVMIVGNGDCGQLGLGDGDDDTRDSLVPLVVASLSAPVANAVIAQHRSSSAAKAIDGMGVVLQQLSTLAGVASLGLDSSLPPRQVGRPSIRSACLSRVRF
jgi:hypothetical protein